MSSGTSRHWLKHRNQVAVLEEVEEEISRTYERKYLLRRPHPLQFEKVGEGKFEAAEDLESTVPVSQSITPTASHALGREETTENLRELRLKQARVSEKQRRSQFDLFLDLVLVATIAVLAETFTEEAFSVENPDRDTGGAFLTYAMSFSLVSRIWKDLRMFMNHFFVDDYLQRFFIVLILTIVIILAGTAPALDTASSHFGQTLNAMILSYIIVRAAFGAMHLYYSILLPWLRNVQLVSFVLTLPSLALWIVTLYVHMPNKIVVFFVALVLEMILEKAHSLPVFSKLSKGYILRRDYEHYLERVSAFLTVLLGSGIELLISSSPAGHQIEPLLRYVIPSFLIIYFLYYMYANGVEDQVYLHAARRGWKVEILWDFLHIPLFGSVPVLGVALASMTTLVYEDQEEPSVHYTLRTAQWITSICLAEIILIMTVLSLLNKPIRAPYKVWVDNRYLRALPRLMIIIILPCLPLGVDPSYHIGTMAGLISAVSVFEFGASWRRDGKLFEPKEVAKESIEIKNEHQIEGGKKAKESACMEAAAENEERKEKHGEALTGQTLTSTSDNGAASP